MRWFCFTLLGIAVIVLLRLSFYTVDAGEYAYVTVFGKPTVIHDGAEEGGGGLHFGWPWPIQAVQRVDRRLQFFDLRPMELLMPDSGGKSVDKNLNVEGCVFWKVADRDAVDIFVRRLGSVDQARNILGERVTSQLGAAISRMRLHDLVGTAPSPRFWLERGRVSDLSLALLQFPAPGPPTNAALAELLVERDFDGRTRVDDKLEELRQGLVRNLKAPFRTDYGIELVDIRLKRYNYPGAARAAIFDRIKSERATKKKEYEAEGDYQARKIATEAEEAARKLLAEARLEEQRIKAEADAEAMVIRNRAHTQDPEFYEFLKKEYVPAARGTIGAAGLPNGRLQG